MRAREVEPIVDPNSRANRVKLAAMITRLFDHWDLDKTERLALLGLSENARMTLTRYREGKPLGKNRDLLDRASHLLGIHKSLRILFPHNRDLAYQWPKSPNKQLQNMSPVEFVRQEGFEGLAAVRRMLDIDRGR